MAPWNNTSPPWLQRSRKTSGKLLVSGSGPVGPASHTFDSIMSDKPEGELRSLWILPVSLLLYMAVLAAIGYLVFFR